MPIMAIAAVVWVGYAVFRAVVASRRSSRPNAIEEFQRAEEVRREIRRKITERKTNPGGPMSRDTPEGEAKRPNSGLAWWRRIFRGIDRR